MHIRHLLSSPPAILSPTNRKNNSKLKQSIHQHHCVLHNSLRGYPPQGRNKTSLLGSLLLRAGSKLGIREILSQQGPFLNSSGGICGPYIYFSDPKMSELPPRSSTTLSLDLSCLYVTPAYYSVATLLDGDLIIPKFFSANLIASSNDPSTAGDQVSHSV